jgi:hypothetical protein
MRRHLIELAAKRDLRAWRKFLPIFGDWLDERGEPEAMVCRATWKRKKGRKRRPHAFAQATEWTVDIPPWCQGWLDQLASAVASDSWSYCLLAQIDYCLNEEWFLHFPPRRLLFRVFMELHTPGPLYIGPLQSFHFSEFPDGVPWPEITFKPALDDHVIRHGLIALDCQVIRNGLIALFWPPDTFTRQREGSRTRMLRRSTPA